MNAPFMKAISINFHGLPSSKNITQDYAIRASLITIEGQPDGLIVTGVFVDGLPQWTAPGSTPELGPLPRRPKPRTDSLIRTERAEVLGPPADRLTRG